MNELPQVYQKYELLFTPHLVPKLRDLRGEEWGKLIDYLSTLPETHPDALAFSMMMIRLNSCLTCEMDSYRAQRGCALCARQAILSFKAISRFQIVIGRKEQRDEMTLKVELSDKDIDKKELADDLNRRFQNLCRVKIDRIEFVERGVIPEEHHNIVDERTWD